MDHVLPHLNNVLQRNGGRKMAKTIEEINEKIKKGEAVVVTAEEIIDLVDKKGFEETTQEVDVITTGTFGPMCSSGAFINLGHSQPRIKINRAWLNDVPVFCGIAAVDIYIGATEMGEYDPLNEVYPGSFNYGGGHVIEDLVAGKKLYLRAESYGTDCYPGRQWETEISLESVKEAWLYNPRNAYQNYNVAVNLSDRVLYTYMGVLRPDLGNANYCSAGQLSPLFNDPAQHRSGADGWRSAYSTVRDHRRFGGASGNESPLAYRLFDGGLRREPRRRHRRTHPGLERGDSKGHRRQG
jgi:uncharacterized protein (DUF39 family)